MFQRVLLSVPPCTANRKYTERHQKETINKKTKTYKKGKNLKENGLVYDIQVSREYLNIER